jgi:hypothetical protein
VLFEPPRRFQGLPEESFRLFTIPSREQRRRRIIATIHPALRDLGHDLIERLGAQAVRPLRPHLPRLDWPSNYQPFCTWLALSEREHGYLAGPQLNVGVHSNYVAVRLGWDTSADAFGRFEFLCRHSDLGEELVELACAADLRFATYAAVAWPEGSHRVFHSDHDLAGSLDEVARRGVWWELGHRYDMPGARELACSEALGTEAATILERLLPVYERAAGEARSDSDSEDG